MDYRDLENLGQQVSNRIRDAIDSFDFEKLNQEIRQNAEDVISGVKRSFNDYSNPGAAQKRRFRNRQSSFGSFGSYHKENWQTYRNVKPDWQEAPKNSWNKSQWSSTKSKEQAANASNRPAKAKRQAAMPDYGFPVQRCPKGELSGVLLTVFGALGFGLAGFGAIILGIIAVFSSWLLSVAALWGIAPLIVAFIIMMVIGTHQRNRVKRYRRYIASMKGKSFATFKNLSSITGKSPRYTVRDVSKMLKLGYFPQGHIDSQKTCLMVTDSIYQQYLETMKNAQGTGNGSAGPAKGSPEQEEAADAGKRRQVLELEALGKRYMEIIRKANDDIPDVEISNKLYRMEMIIGKIFDHVKKYPQKADRLSQFQNYYMPMTIKLVETYRDLDGQPIEGENIKKVKQEIEGTLDTINEAYEKLYDSMYQETAMDVSSDISVLRTLLAREGLTKGAFEKKDKKK